MVREFIKLARPSQWTKNGLLFAALVFAGEIRNFAKLETVVVAFALFCLLSSAIYTFNDIVDRGVDRRHPVKRRRPLASGAITVGGAAGFAAVLAIVGLVGAWMIRMELLVVAVIFLILNILYTVALKHVVIIDVLTVALSFVVRAYAGAAAIDVPASKWMLITTLLLALFLSFGKRRHELVVLDTDASDHRASLTTYTPYLLDQMIAVTTPSVLVVYMFYTFSSEVSEKLGTDQLYLTIPFVVYGIFRYLYLIHSKEEGGSPTSLLLADKPILVTVVLWLLTSILILY